MYQHSTVDIWSLYLFEHSAILFRILTVTVFVKVKRYLINVWLNINDFLNIHSRYYNNFWKNMTISYNIYIELGLLSVWNNAYSSCVWMGLVLYHHPKNMPFLAHSWQRLIDILVKMDVNVLHMMHAIWCIQKWWGGKKEVGEWIWEMGDYAV